MPKSLKALSVSWTPSTTLCATTVHQDAYWKRQTTFGMHLRCMHRPTSRLPTVNLFGVESTASPPHHCFRFKNWSLPNHLLRFMLTSLLSSPFPSSSFRLFASYHVDELDARVVGKKEPDRFNTMENVLYCMCGDWEEPQVHAYSHFSFFVFE